MKTPIHLSRVRGVTLLEVVLAVAVFAFGMLALAQMQGNLARSSADSNARTVASNLAEEVIERARNWQQKGSDPANPSSLTTQIFAFEDLVAGAPMEATVYRGGSGDVDDMRYDISAAITDYTYESAEATSFCDLSDALCSGTGGVAFKAMEVTVSWTSADFRSGDGTTVGDLNSGEVIVTGLISSVPSFASGKVITPDDGETASPPSTYDPGETPDVIALSLDGSKLKESSSPVPDVVRSGELAETWFDVITYNQSDSTFVRREEYVAVSCECELNRPSGDGDDGLPPTIWNGVEYSSEIAVGKWWGEAPSNLNQSLYCATCCRDHHDGDAGVAADSLPADDRYDALEGVNADHEHYGRNNRGELVLADSDGDDYVEACRLIRKDGFFRVAQDFQLEGLNAFPDLYLDVSGANTYSQYVVEAIEDFHTENLAALPSPTSLSYDFPADTPEDATTLPTAVNTNSQQLRARGIYIDHLGTEAREIVNCMLGYDPVTQDPPGDPGTGDECGAPGATTWLEIYPFFDTQLTFLAYWSEDSGRDPVIVTTDAVETGNTHDRGRAYLSSTEGAFVTVDSEVQTGNIGLTVTDPINPAQESGANYVGYSLTIDANGSGPVSPVDGWIISGDIVSSVKGAQAADAQISGSSGVVCGRTQTSFTCIQEYTAIGPRITVSGYYRNGNTQLWACTDTGGEGEMSAPIYDSSPPDMSATWSLPGADISGMVINIQDTACSDG